LPLLLLLNLNMQLKNLAASEDSSIPQEFVILLANLAASGECARGDSTTNRMSDPEIHEKYLMEAFDEAFRSVEGNIGGPFGAVIVKDGIVIGKGVNRVTSRNDPTAHAEIEAIREAAKNIHDFNLSGAILYSTCEPCPMCLSAIYWANITGVYFCSTRHDAEAIGFRDNHIYEELNLLPDQRSIFFRKIDHPIAVKLSRTWSEKKDKKPY